MNKCLYFSLSTRSQERLRRDADQRVDRYKDENSQLTSRLEQAAAEHERIVSTLKNVIT